MIPDLPGISQLHTAMLRLSLVQSKADEIANGGETVDPDEWGNVEEKLLDARDTFWRWHYFVTGIPTERMMEVLA